MSLPGTLTFANGICYVLLATWLASAVLARGLIQTLLRLEESETPDFLPGYVTGIGMDLTSNYGTVSVAFANGSRTNIAKVNATPEYIAAMYDFSLDASQHPTPPYRSYLDMIRDAPRQRARHRRKSQGLPASENVGALAKMISALRRSAQDYLNFEVNSALVATPDLVALYREDVEDALEYVGLKSLDQPNHLFRLFRETAAVQGHYNFGLCQKPFEPAACSDELGKMNWTDILTVVYTRRSLCLEVCVMHSAYYVAPYRSHPTSMDLTLGSDAMTGGPDDAAYWEAVRERIISAIVAALQYRHPKRVFLMGEDVGSTKLRHILSDVLLKMLGYMPEVYDDDPVFAAANGAAEFARRGGYRSNTSELIPLS